MGRYDDLQSFYAACDESARLATGVFRLELERTRELLAARLPPSPAVVLDVGGGPGVHARWLAGLGYEVHLVDIVPRHVEQALAKDTGGPPLASAAVGDARRLVRADSSVDVALLLGPLYHLPEPGDRRAALAEALRVLRPGGLLAAAGISRFVSLLGVLAQAGRPTPDALAIVDEDLCTGRHVNTTDSLEWFTRAYFHRPEELRAEVTDAGFGEVDVVGLEGPFWIAAAFEALWQDETGRTTAMRWARAVEREESLLGVSAHILAFARKPD
jgi:ubiquinone/menaquinone biosynthesis C-methylase UbiE